MMLVLQEGVVDQLRLVPAPAKKAVRATLRRLSEDPLDDRLDLKPLAGPGPNQYYRARVGSYRIVYTIAPHAIYIDRVFHRREGYGWLERM